MNAIWKREFFSYMRGVTGWLFIAFLLLFEGILCVVNNIILGSARFEATMATLEMVLILAVPILAMRSVAEDKHNRTDQLLYALPMKLSDVVLGKYFAMLAILGIACGVIALYPLFLGMYGFSAYGTAYSSLLGFFLLGAALLAFCMFLSSLTESQIIAAVIGVAGVLALYLLDMLAMVLPSGAGASFLSFVILVLLVALILGLLTKNPTVAAIAGIVGILPLLIVFLVSRGSFDGLFRRFLTGMSLFSRYNSFCNGIFDLSSIVYDVSFAAFFLFLTDQALEKKRWS